ncbi:MAG: hypothetical protein C7B43_02770 [Sulfobacillus benefaciens]|uniref:Uncharacterized protein n=1 Tax=Sulfobacillus benefaciens TaxID=453960 RepID=A0A2T2XA31_9FIRM|nr:MAG: hypothetical protein C7B43_02770 [Sulfobacillus benefaciens]
MNVYDFPHRAKGQTTPYSVYKVTTTGALANVDPPHHNPAEFVLASVRCWWEVIGQKRCPGRHFEARARKRHCFYWLRRISHRKILGVILFIILSPYQAMDT